jgi:hypothetical protein
MAIVGTFSAPIIHILVPDARAIPDNMVTDAPASAPADASADNLTVETVATTQTGGYPVAGGTPSTSGLSLTVDVASQGQVDGVGTYTYTDGTNTYGQSPLYSLTGFETVVTASSGNGYQRPRGLTLDDGTVLVAAENWIDNQVKIFERDPDTGDWTPGAVVWTSPTAFSSLQHPSPDIYRVWDRRTRQWVLWVAALQDDTTASTANQRLVLSYSKDDGATWSTITTSLSFAATAITYDMLRVKYDPLSKNLVLGVVRNSAGTYTGLYYASADYGATWTALASASISDTRMHDIQVTAGGTFYLVEVDSGGNVDLWAMTGVSSQWTAIQSPINVTAATIGTYRSIALAITPSNTLWVDFRDNTNLITRAYSTDGGRSFTQTHALSEEPATGVVFNGSVYHTGQLLLLGTMSSSGTTYDNSIVALVGGGISTIASTWTPAGYDPYIPTDIPATRSAQYAFTTSGATAQSIATDSAGNLEYDLSNHNSTGYVTTTYTGASQVVTHAARWVLSDDTSGGSTASDAIAIKIGANTTGSGQYCQGGLRLNFTSRSVRAYDYVAGANVGSSVSWATGGPVEVLVAVSYPGDGSNSQMSAWVKLVADSVWTPIVVDQTITRGAGSVRTIVWGKVSASTANVQTIAMIPYLVSQNTTLGDTSPEPSGIIASSQMDRIPAGIYLRWDGGALRAGDSWTVRAASLTPVSFTSPYSVSPSPLRQWVSPAVSAGSTVRVAVYDFGASYVGFLARASSLVGLQWANMPGVQSVELSRWTGSAWSAIVTASTEYASYPNWARATAGSYTFYAPTSNSSIKALAPNELKGMWAYISDGTDSIGGTVLRNGTGQFTASGVQAWIELDPATVVTVAGGGLASLATTSGGTVLKIYASDGIAVGAQQFEATRYYGVSMTLAPGFTTPKAGLLSFGEVLTPSRPVRAGASISRTTDPRSDRALRRVELPYDTILVPAGTYASTSTVQNSESFNGVTPRAAVDNNVILLTSLLDSVGRSRGQKRGVPVGLVIDGNWTDDPATTTQVYLGQTTLAGYVSSSIDVTTSMGFLRPTSYGPTQQGLSVTFDEAALWLPTV